MVGFYETTFLQEGLVKITNQRTLVGTATYPMSEIKSVTVIMRERSSLPVWPGAGGLFLILWSFVDQTGYFGPFFTLGVMLIILALAIRLLARPSYVIQIRNAAGVSDIFGSTDLALIQRILGAMNRATAGRLAPPEQERHESVDDIFRRA
jgi:hypothetical protein